VRVRFPQRGHTMRLSSTAAAQKFLASGPAEAQAQLVVRSSFIMDHSGRRGQQAERGV
jgi:hypothetical protein